jgi:hypothetical protein
MSNLSISYPFWFLLFVGLTGLVYASILYVKNKKQKFGSILLYSLFMLRFIIVSALCFLLLSPFVKTRKKYTEKPIIVMGIDNSRSIVSGKDSSFYNDAFKSDIDDLRGRLEEDYEVETVLFGEEIRKNEVPFFTDELSDYAGFIAFLRDNYTGYNVGATLIAGDGINNRGIDPEFAAAGLGYPVYTLALGDTIRGRDLAISDVRYNSIVYQGDDFPVEVTVSATNMNDENATLTVYGFGNREINKNIQLKSDQFTTSVLLSLNARNKGKQRIRLVLTTNADELSNSNNSRDIFIDVLKSRQKILLLANSPHPDVAALQASLSQSGNYETEVQYPGNFRANINEYDLVVLHQLPSYNQAFQGTLNELREKNNIPLLFILGKQSSFNLFNRYFDGIDLRANNRNLEEAEFIFNPRFTAFSFSSNYAAQLSELPPLIVPFGNYRIAQNTEIFGYQRLNRIETELPLIMFSKKDENRHGLIAGEGLWMWRMHTYLQTGNYESFDALVNKIVQYLMVRKDKRNFRVISKGEYNSRDRVTILAELYNQSMEPVNESDVNFRLTNESGEQFNYLFSPEGSGYLLDLDRLPVGVYRYLANTQLGKDSYRESGEFVVSQRSLEVENLNADHGMLFRLASSNGGEMLYPSQLSSFPEQLTSRDDLKNRFYYEEKYSGLHDMPWIIGLILLLLTLEWLLRKYFGSY